ncbi:exostosin family protein [Tripterygium wilfordii]|uniref:ER membrane protein complex subunit 1 n=1 Tax=Tripterygium wilfordii TaxID=458696 RepID=A0A7J7DA95_TRIWF|nr:exostosin family protein [Tripterygium wilfordii]
MLSPHLIYAMERFFGDMILGPNDAVNGIDIALGKYVITLSSEGSILRAWNLPDGQMVWETYLLGNQQSNSLLVVPPNLRVEDNLIFVFSKGCLHGISNIDGEVLWKRDFAAESVQVQQVIQPLDNDIIHVVGFTGSSQFNAYQISSKSGELLKRESAVFPGGFTGEVSVVSRGTLTILDSSRKSLVTIRFLDGEISFQQTYISNIMEGSLGMVMILPSVLPGMVAVKSDALTIFMRVTDEGKLDVVDKITHATAVSDTLSFLKGQQAFALVQHGGDEIQLTVKVGHDWNNDLLKESIKMDHHRGLVHKVFINNYVRTDKSHGFRALIVMEDHSLLLLQQGEVVWRRDDGLASIIDVTASELPVQKEGVSVAKVEHNLFEWLKGHILKLKGSLMLASPEDVAAIQEIRLKSSEKSKMTRDHNGFQKLLIVLTKAGKLYALHTGDGRVVWSLLLQSLHKSHECENPTALNLYQWQVPHHHALDENPSVLVVGRCGPSAEAPGVLSFVDTYTGNEVSYMSLVHSVTQVIPLPFTDSTEQRLHLLVDVDNHVHLYPKTQEALGIFESEFSNIYWYSVEVDNGVIKGHVLKSNCIGELDDGYCFDSSDIWSVVFPSESEKIIATVTRKLNEVVHTQTKVIGNQDVLYKYLLKNVLFVATVSPKASGDVGSATPEESWLVVYVIDTVTGRILHHMTHYGSHGPVHESYFFTHSVKEISVTSTAKGITSKQLLIGTIGDQVLALDKRFLDPRRSINPSEAGKEEGIIPLADSLPIISQSYVTHAVRVEDLRGIVTVPAKLESTTLVLVYGVDLFFTRLAPSRTYDSLTEDFSYALLLITIVALIAAIFVTWIMSERKELQEKWRSWENENTLLVYDLVWLSSVQTRKLGERMGVDSPVVLAVNPVFLAVNMDTRCLSIIDLCRVVANALTIPPGEDTVSVKYHLLSASVVVLLHHVKLLSSSE